MSTRFQICAYTPSFILDTKLLLVIKQPVR